MAREDAHFRLRLPADLKMEIEAAADANNRSINAEIIHRLGIARDTNKLNVQFEQLANQAQMHDEQIKELRKILTENKERLKEMKDKANAEGS